MVDSYRRNSWICIVVSTRGSRNRDIGHHTMGIYQSHRGSRSDPWLRCNRNAWSLGLTGWSRDMDDLSSADWGLARKCWASYSYIYVDEQSRTNYVIINWGIKRYAQRTWVQVQHYTECSLFNFFLADSSFQPVKVDESSDLGGDLQTQVKLGQHCFLNAGFVLWT